MKWQERKHARRMVSRQHGRPMVCPACGNDIYTDGPHVCPPGFVKPASEVQTFYGYNSLNQCCRHWMLLGWPEVNGRPKLENDENGKMHFDCPRCGKPLWFDIVNPDVLLTWDQQERGIPQPPAIVGGRITTPSWN